MSSRDEQEKQTASSVPNAVRRRLIKGGATLPLVASLSPNAALAATSAMNCALTGVSNMKFESAGNSVNGDNAVRKLVTFYRLNGEGRKGFYEVNPGMYYQGNGKRYYPTAEELSSLDKEDAWVLALYDISGSEPQFVGYWPEADVDGEFATPLSASCWTSVEASINDVTIS